MIFWSPCAVRDAAAASSGDCCATYRECTQKSMCTLTTYKIEQYRRRQQIFGDGYTPVPASPTPPKEGVFNYSRGRGSIVINQEVDAS